MNPSEATDPSGAVNRTRLFNGLRLGLLPTAFSFVLVSNILGQLKTEFILSNTQVGYIGGAALWGMAVSLLTIGPFLERIGFKTGTKMALCGHLCGVTLFLAAAPFAGQPFAFWILFLGAIGFGAGNGMIEVVGNPMVVALFPQRKTTKLNNFHAFYSGGMVLGGLLGWSLSQIGAIGSLNVGHWTFQIAIIYIPIAIYGFMLLPVTFPKSESAASGISIGEMVRYTLAEPLLWGLIVLKMFTLSLEMGPNRWIPDVLQAAGVHGMLVLVWISGLMTVLRLFAGPFVERFSPTGMLFGASVLTGCGLLMFSFIESGLLPLLLAGTVFACGVAFLFPTMVGLMSERFPRAGSLGIVVMIGLGFFAAGASNGIMGAIADDYLPEGLNTQSTLSVLRQVEQRYPAYVEQAKKQSSDFAALERLGYRAIDVEAALNRSREALEQYKDKGSFDGATVGNALRATVDSNVKAEADLIASATSLLRSADNYGGRKAFFWIGPVAFLIAVVFLILYSRNRKQGGYRAVQLERIA